MCSRQERVRRQQQRVILPPVSVSRIVHPRFFGALHCVTQLAERLVNGVADARQILCAPIGMLEDESYPADCTLRLLRIVARATNQDLGASRTRICAELGADAEDLAAGPLRHLLERYGFSVLDHPDAGK